METLGPDGRIHSADIRNLRRREGRCGTCRTDPVLCYGIKKKWGGMKSEKVPLTEPGRVFEGMCLRCHPEMDPDGGRSNCKAPDLKQQQRPSDRLSLMRSSQIGGRNIGTRNLGLARNRNEDFASSMPIMGSLDRNSQSEHELLDLFNEDEEPAGQALGSLERLPASMPDLNVAPSSPSRNTDQEEGASNPPDSRSNPAAAGKSELSERDAQHQHSQTQQQHSQPSLLRVIEEDNSSNNDATTETDDDDGDVLAKLIAQHLKNNDVPEPKFIPNQKTFLKNAVLDLDDMADDISVLTYGTIFEGRESLASQISKQPTRQRSYFSRGDSRNLPPPRGTSSSSGGASGEPSLMVSHQISEPTAPEPTVPAQPPGGHDAAAEAAPASLAERSHEAEAPDLLVLRETIDDFAVAGADAESIDMVTNELMKDSATSISENLALYCLHTLMELARKSEENKHRIIFVGSTFEVIIEAMQIYRGRSAEVQQRACGVLWSLSMDPNHRKHVTHRGGGKAITDGMIAHAEKTDLQVMALGALKVLSFDSVSKSTLRASLSVISDTMKTHLSNATIQADGAVILGNLTMDNASDFVAPVTAKEVDALVHGILAHPDALDVHESACFTLMSLAMLANNVELIRNNALTRTAIDLACRKHPEVRRILEMLYVRCWGERE